MNYKVKAIVFISITCNLIFIGWFGLSIFRCGGSSYITTPGNCVGQNRGILRRVQTRTSQVSLYRQMRQLQFDALPQSNRAIVFVGDSLTDQGEWAEWLGNANVKNRGISGDTTDGAIARLPQIIEAKPRKIFLMIGTNDIWNQGKSVAEVIKNYRILLETIKAKTPTTQVFVQSLLPVNNQEHRIKVDNNDLMAVNRQLQDLAQEFNYTYIDLYNKLVNDQNQLDLKYTLDGVHLNGAGYLKWKTIIETHVAKSPTP